MKKFNHKNAWDKKQEKKVKKEKSDLIRWSHEMKESNKNRTIEITFESVKK